MRLISDIVVRAGGSERRVGLYEGDLSSIPAEQAVDTIVVSAFPDDYTPTRTSLIGALHRAGVSVAALAEDKQVDLRQFSSCWLSKPIEREGVHFQRILCFEHEGRGSAAELGGDVFRSLVPFVAGDPPMTTVALPLLATGHQGESPRSMLEALTRASVEWLSAGLPLDEIKIVVRPSSGTPALSAAFAEIKRAVRGDDDEDSGHRFDLFISYSHANRQQADELVEKLVKRRADLRVFVDRLELDAGAAWQQQIFDSLESSRRVICLLTPDYLASKVCKDEFNIAWMLHRETGGTLLRPFYIFTAKLPAYMRHVQYEDVREADPEKIGAAVDRVVASLP